MILTLLVGCRRHTVDVLGFLADWLLDPSGVVEGMRDRRRERRMRQRGRAAEIPCALRVVDGTHARLGRRWTRGTARVPPGAVVFQPNSWWKRMTIPVQSAALLPPGDLPRWTSRALGAQPRRISLETAQATLEWLVPEEQLQRALGVTRPRAR